MRVWEPKSAYAAKGGKTREGGDWGPLMDAIAACRSPEAVEDFFTAFLLDNARNLPGGWTEDVRDACDARKAELETILADQAMDRVVGEIWRHG